MSFNVQTILKYDGYPEYARPDNGHTVYKGDKTYNDTQVVLHPRELIVEFNCHINLEVCATIKAIKYVHMYVYKGPDCATLQVQGHDEIVAYFDSHYISAVEAAWHISKFEMHLENASVYHLPVRLENQQTVAYRASDGVQQILQAAANRDTCLLGWFKANLDPACIAAGKVTVEEQSVWQCKPQLCSRSSRFLIIRIYGFTG